MNFVHFSFLSYLVAYFVSKTLYRYIQLLVAMFVVLRSTWFKIE